MGVKQYRLVHFVPDPFSGARMPVAALVQQESGKVQVARALHLPGSDCLGRATAEQAMLMALDSLEGAESFTSLPRSAGPHVMLDLPRAVPEDVPDAVAWVEKQVLPQRPEKQKATRATRSPLRSTWGYRFFERYEVQPYVHKTFEAGKDAALFTKGVGGALAEIAHWVGHPDVGLFLMEPVLPGRQQFTSDLREVGTKFGAYRYQLDRNALEGVKDRTKDDCVHPCGWPRGKP